MSNLSTRLIDILVEAGLPEQFRGVVTDVHITGDGECVVTTLMPRGLFDSFPGVGVVEQNGVGPLYVKHEIGIGHHREARGVEVL